MKEYGKEALVQPVEKRGEKVMSWYKRHPTEVYGGFLTPPVRVCSTVVKNYDSVAI